MKTVAKVDIYDIVPVSLTATTQNLLTIIRNTDIETYKHSKNVAQYSYDFGMEIGLEYEYCQNLYVTGLLHDIGKYGINQSILKSPSKLTCIQQIIIKYHPEIGAEILNSLAFPKSIVEAVYYHHERYDGTGYYGKIGHELPVYSQIIALADVYDALTSNRRYRQRLSSQEALEEMTRSVGQFSPDLLSRFIKYINQ